MKVLKVLLALLTTLAVALTAALLLIQDKKRAPLYPDLRKRAVTPVLHKSIPQPERQRRTGWGMCCFMAYKKTPPCLPQRCF